MPRVDGLVEFLAIVDAGSVSAAARDLGVPRATLSRRLTALEDALQVRLIRRETRQIGLTHAGELLAQRARGVVSAIEDAVLAVQAAQGNVSGVLRLSTPPLYLFHDLLLRFGLAHPEVEIQASGTPTTIDLVAEGVDVAMRAGSLRTDGLVARRLWNDPISPVAAPGYLDEHGRPTTPDDLVQHECIVSFEHAWQPHRTWPLKAGGRVPIHPRFACHDHLFQLTGAIAGYGLALLPDRLSQPYVDSGQLERVLPDVVGGMNPMSLVFPDRKYMPAQVRAFIDFTVDYFENSPYPDGQRIDRRLLPPVTTP